MTAIRTAPNRDSAPAAAAPDEAGRHAGVLMAIRPRYGAPLVAAWLAGIIFNLLTASGFYDVALRDFGLMVAAIALARLAARHDA